MRISQAAAGRYRTPGVLGHIDMGNNRPWDRSVQGRLYIEDLRFKLELLERGYRISTKVSDDNVIFDFDGIMGDRPTFYDSSYDTPDDYVPQGEKERQLAALLEEYFELYYKKSEKIENPPPLNEALTGVTDSEIIVCGERLAIERDENGAITTIRRCYWHPGTKGAIYDVNANEGYFQHQEAYPYYYNPKWYVRRGVKMTPDQLDSFKFQLATIITQWKALQQKVEETMRDSIANFRVYLKSTLNEESNRVYED